MHRRLAEAEFASYLNRQCDMKKAFMQHVTCVVATKKVVNCEKSQYPFNRILQGETK